MRVVFVPSSDKHWVQYYIRQQTGKGFVGDPYQRGGGLGNIFRGLYRFLLPLAKSAGKAVGKQALRTGAHIASDLVAGGDLKKVLKTRGKRGASALLRSAASKLEQTGGRRRSIKGRTPKKKVIRGKKRKSRAKSKKKKKITKRTTKTIKKHD
jgi:hypothetical protein